LIPTTQHLLEVVGLERPLTPSHVVFDDEKGDPLPIMTDYRKFIVRGTGFIEELYGYTGSILHLSGRIDRGRSWQLAAFVVHALHRINRLASLEDQADTIVWATGEFFVRPSLRIQSVGSLQTKLEKSFERLANERRQDRRVIVAWPAADDRDISTDMKRRLEDIGVGIVGPGKANATPGEEGPHGIEHVKELLAQLDLDIPAWPAAAASKIPERPFRGLEVFEETDREVFLGRGRARAEALEQIRDAAELGCGFLLIHGASGAGKSSFARAGLIPAIKELDRSWYSTVMIPGRGGVPAMQTLRQALAQSGLNIVGLEGPDGDTPAALASPVSRTLVGAKLILLVDQLDELLEEREADAASDRDIELFGQVLEELARSGNVWVIATIRAEFLDRLLARDAFARLASGSRRRYLLQPPTRAELREIITGTGVDFEGQDEHGKPLAELLVDAATAAPESLPLLQVALKELYEVSGKTGTIGYASYREHKGGIEGAIGSWAERRVEALLDDRDSEKRIDASDLDRVILDLGRLDRISNSFVPRELIVNRQSGDTGRQRVIDALGEARLVVVDNLVVRVAHAAVLSHWPRASKLFAAHQAAIALRDRLEDEAKDWLTQSRDEGLVIPDGIRLREAMDLSKNGQVHLSRGVQDYIKASSDHADEQRDAERKRQAELIVAQNERIAADQARIAADQATIAARNATIAWIRTLSIAMALILVGAVAQMARGNYLYSGGLSILSPGPLPVWKTRYEKEKLANEQLREGTFQKGHVLPLLAIAHQRGEDITTLHLPFPASSAYKILFLLGPFGNGHFALPWKDVTALSTLSPAELDAQVHELLAKWPDALMEFLRVGDTGYRPLKEKLFALLPESEAKKIVASSGGDPMDLSLDKIEHALTPAPAVSPEDVADQIKRLFPKEPGSSRIPGLN
jgi:hypothetical protein